jgi:hypothetical protein
MPASLPGVLLGDDIHNLPVGWIDDQNIVPH